MLPQSCRLIGPIHFYDEETTRGVQETMAKKKGNRALTEIPSKSL